MASNPGHFAIHLPTKPYLACYIASQYGNPVVLNNNSLMGVVIFSLLQKSIFIHDNIRSKHLMFRGFTTEIKCLAPYRCMSSYGIDLSDAHIIQINRFFDEMFQESLYHFVQRNSDATARVKGIDRAIELFADQHGIILDQHATFENLKKMEYRFRKNREEILSKNVPSITQMIQPSLFAVS